MEKAPQVETEVAEAVVMKVVERSRPLAHSCPASAAPLPTAQQSGVQAPERRVSNHMN